MQKTQSEGLHTYRRVSRKSLSKASHGKLEQKAKPPKAPVKVRVGILTWNVGNTDPVAANRDVFSTLLPLQKHRYDLVVIGVQECRYNDRNTLSSKTSFSSLDTTHLDSDVSDNEGGGTQAKKKAAKPSGCEKCLFGGLSSVRFALAGIAHHLGVTKAHPFVFDTVLKSHMHAHNFVCVATESLMEMRTYVFVDAYSRIFSLLDNIEVATEATGLLHIYGNKGGTVIRLNICDTSLAFFNCHLAAHQDCAPQRRANVVEVLQGARVARRELDACIQTTHTFFFGDLNFRLDPGYMGDKQNTTPSTIRMQKVHELLQQRNFKALLAHDQLRVELTNNGLLPGFSDALCTSNHPHPPTFKVNRFDHFEEEDDPRAEPVLPNADTDTDKEPTTSTNNPSNKIRGSNNRSQNSTGSTENQNNNDTDGMELNDDSKPLRLPNYSAKRVPSYCDRILFRSLPSSASNLTLHHLKAIQTVNSSDHLPVFASFHLSVPPPLRPSSRRSNPSLEVSNLRCSSEFAVTRVLVVCIPSHIMREHISKATPENVDGMTVFENAQLFPLQDTAKLCTLHLVLSAWSKKKLIGQVVVAVPSESSPATEVFSRLELNGVLSRCWIQLTVTIATASKIDGNRKMGPSRLLARRVPSWSKSVARRAMSRSSITNPLRALKLSTPRQNNNNQHKELVDSTTTDISVTNDTAKATRKSGSHKRAITMSFGRNSLLRKSVILSRSNSLSSTGTNLRKSSLMNDAGQPSQNFVDVVSAEIVAGAWAGALAQLNES